MKFYLPAIFVALSASNMALGESVAGTDDERDMIRGVIAPVTRAVVATEIVARIAKVPFRNGQKFAEGDVLVEFDCQRLKAELAAASATVIGARQVYDNNLELIKHDAVGEHEVELSKTELNRTASQYKAQKAMVNECTLKAPYSGRIVQSHVNQFETPSQGAPLLEIINDSELELELIVPSNWLRWLSADTSFDFKVDETQKTYRAHVSQIGATVDAISQTVKITGKFDIHPDRILAGMSGTADFDNAAIVSAR